jgi:hypothetical protein
MQKVFVVQHLREDPDGYDNVKFIGVYSSRRKAEAAIAKFALLPGFCSTPAGFDIQQYALDEDHWTEGFVDVTQDAPELS